jgi:hypothetical protein
MTYNLDPHLRRTSLHVACCNVGDGGRSGTSADAVTGTGNSAIAHPGPPPSPNAVMLSSARRLASRAHTLTRASSTTSSPRPRVIFSGIQPTGIPHVRLPRPGRLPAPADTQRGSSATTSARSAAGVSCRTARRRATSCSSASSAGTRSRSRRPRLRCARRGATRSPSSSRSGSTRSAWCSSTRTTCAAPLGYVRCADRYVCARTRTTWSSRGSWGALRPSGACGG